MEAIILAGGLGTRLRSVVADVPKCMAPINNIPFISFISTYLQNEGVRVREVYEVGSAVIISILVSIGSAGTNDGVHLVGKAARANVAIGNTAGVLIVNLSFGNFVFLLACLRGDGVVHGSTDGHAEVESTSDARCAVEG